MEVISSPSGSGRSGVVDINFLDEEMFAKMENRCLFFITQVSPKSWKSQNYAGVDKINNSIRMRPDSSSLHSNSYETFVTAIRMVEAIYFKGERPGSGGCIA
jgi:hypothetical protein